MKKIKLYPCLAFLIWAGQIINLYVWLKLNVNYLTYDSHRHFLVSLKIFKEYGRFAPDILSHCVALTQRHPPLVMMATAPFYFIFGSSQDSGVLINAAVFLAVLIFAVYKIGATVLSPKAGVLAAVILTMYPVVFNQLKVYMLDLPLAAAVSLSIYFLIRSDNFRNLKYNLFFLLAFISGMLIKVNFIIFLSLPLGYSLFKCFSRFRIKLSFSRQGVNQGGRKWMGNPLVPVLILLLAGILMIPGALYYFSAESFISYVGRGTVIEKLESFWARFVLGPEYLGTWPSVAPPPGSMSARIHAFLWYIWGFMNWQVSFLFFAVFLIGGFYFIRQRVNYKPILLFWIIGSFVLLGSIIYGIGINMEVSAVRYSLPLLPAAAIISAIGIMQISAKGVRRFLIAAAVALGAGQVVLISYPLGLKLKTIEIPLSFYDKYNFFPESIVIFDSRAWAVSGSDSGSHPRNFKEEIKICENIFRVINDSNEAATEKKVTVIPDDTRLWYLQYLAQSRGKPLNFLCDWNYARPIGWNYTDTFDKSVIFRGFILDADYIIDKDGGWQGENYMLPIVDEIRNKFNSYKSRFSLLSRLKWTDGADIFIYQKNRKEE